MKSYISISKEIRTDLFVTVFDKLDGSNIRAEWSPKRGFYKFGSRKQILDPKDKHLGKAVSLIQDTYAEALADVFIQQKWTKNIVCFFEYYGPKSFAGQHAEGDDHRVTLIDVSPYKQGLIPPQKFIKLFGDLGVPDILFRGFLTQTLVEAIKGSSLPGISLEGVICKAPNPNGKKTSQPVMFKIKTGAWLERLKEHCGGNSYLYERLS
jgi:hypothetical protein